MKRLKDILAEVSVSQQMNDIDDLMQFYLRGKKMNLDVFSRGADAIKDLHGDKAWEAIRKMAAKYNRVPGKALGQEIYNEYEFATRRK